MKKTCLFISILFLSIPILMAQNFIRTESGIKTQISSMDIEISFLGSASVRVLKTVVGENLNKESLSVIKIPENIKLSVDQQGDVLSLKSAKLKVDIDLTSGAVSYFSLSGQKLLAEKVSGTTFTHFNDAGTNTYTVGQTFLLDKDESIYGLGQQQSGKLSQRGVKVNMIQGNTDDYVPYFTSTKGYGLFWDNYSPTLFEDSPEGTLFRSDVGDCVDYYFMYGEDLDGSVALMRDLTGHVPMFPLWTYGFWQSKERYKSQNEIVGVVKKYRELGVPLDGIIQDWQYWGSNYLWNAMDFLNPEFPDPRKMIDDIHNMSAHIIISVWASFGPQTKQYREMDPQGMLLDFQTWPQSGLEKWPPDMDYPSGVKPYDPFNPEARKIYWKYLEKGLFSLGIDGWWMDSTEPDHLSFKPTDLDNKTYLGSFRKVRNAYPLMAVGGVAEHQLATNSQKRVFILTRSAFAGQQRYGANTWSGDVNSNWQSLRNQIPAGLNFSLCAIPYWNSDIGGFFASSYNRGWSDGTKNPSFQELYVRWAQFGAFTPMMRSHGADVPREIYNFGKKGEPIYDAIEKAINLRYSLLPYIYSTAWDVTHNQSTFMRALVMDFPQDNKVADLNSEYMFGRSILVAPIVKAQYTTESTRRTNSGDGAGANATNQDNSGSVDFNQQKSETIYLPEGTRWFDFWTNQQYNGGQEITIATTIDMIPLFIKSGSIIPFGPKVQYAEEKRWDNLEICIYPGADGKFVLYEDENDNYNYQKGEYSTIEFIWDDSKRELTIGKCEGSFNGMLKERVFNITVSDNENSDLNISHSALYNGKKIKVKIK